VEALAARRTRKEIASEYSSDSNTIPSYNLDTSYKFDFGLDPIESESELNTIEEPLLGPAAGLVITSTPTGRFVYWLDRKPVDQTNENSRRVAYLETLPFQEGIPLSLNEDEHTPTEVDTTNSTSALPTVRFSWQPGTLKLQKTDPISTSMTFWTTRNQLTHPQRDY
jgi:hypothetical protein